MQPTWDLLTSRPALWYPGMDEQEWEFEIEQMLSVALGKHLLLKGDINFNQYEDLLNENGLNPIDAIEDWSEGRFYAY